MMKAMYISLACGFALCAGSLHAADMARIEGGSYRPL